MDCLQCGVEILSPKKKFCCKNHQTNWRAANIYGYKYQRNYRSRNPRNYLSQLRSYYNRKETLSLDFLEDLYHKQLGKCAISGIALTYGQNTGRCPTNASIDRIDSSGGYKPENVQLVCHKINMMKGEGTLEELLIWCKEILNHANT